MPVVPLTALASTENPIRRRSDKIGPNLAAREFPNHNPTVD